VKAFISNSKAGFNYETLETYEAGLQLLGHEVKSIRAGHATISEAFIVTENNALYLVKAYIAPYQVKNTPATHDPYRKRKLLVTKKELREIAQRREEAGLTLIPLSLYDRHGLLKLQFALARGKKKHDKRQTIKSRDAEREMRRLMKS
jgi:SsrA-binding protein